MLDKVIEILEEFVDGEPEINGDSQLVSDLGLSSLDIINIIVAFEDEFDIEVPDRIIPQFRKVQDIVDYMEKHQFQ